MGNEGSMVQSGQQNSNSSDAAKRIKFYCDEVDKFYVSELTKQQFTQQLFAEIQQMPHPTIGVIKISRTFILERLFIVLSQNSRTKCVSCKQLKDLIEDSSKNPQKIIQKSFQLLDIDKDKSISDAEFLNYMDNCFVSLMAAMEKDLTENQLKLTLKDWISKNKKVFFEEILKIFQKHKKSDPVKWNYSDFKRWILSGENWTMDIALGAKKYRVPLNLLCLFGMPKPV